MPVDISEATLKSAGRVTFAADVLEVKPEIVIKPSLSNNIFKPFNPLHAIQAARNDPEGRRAHSKMAAVHYKSKLIQSKVSDRFDSGAEGILQSLGSKEAESRISQRVESIIDATTLSKVSGLNKPSILVPARLSDSAEVGANKRADSAESTVLHIDTSITRATTKSFVKSISRASSRRTKMIQTPKNQNITRIAMGTGPLSGSPSGRSNAASKTSPNSVEERKTFVVPSHNELDDWFKVCAKVESLEHSGQVSTKVWIHSPTCSPKSPATCHYGKPKSPNGGHAFWRDIASLVHGTNKLEQVKGSFTFTRPPACYGDTRCRRKADTLKAQEILVQHYRKLEQVLERDKKVKRDHEYELAILKELFCTLLALDGGKPSIRQAAALLNLAKYWLRAANKHQARLAVDSVLRILEFLIKEHTEKTRDLITPLKGSPISKVKVYENSRDILKALCSLEAKTRLWMKDNLVIE